MEDDLKANKLSIQDTEDFRFSAGNPIILVHEKNPKVIIGGYAVKINGTKIQVSYENPLNPITTFAKPAWTRGDRSYFIEDFNRWKEFSDPQISSREGNLVGNINAGLGDFIAMGANEKMKVCGFVCEIKTGSLLLSHQNPLMGDEFYTPDQSTYKKSLQCRYEQTIGTRRYRISFFNCFSVLMRPGQLCLEQKALEEE
jgi:hypothetical protein